MKITRAISEMPMSMEGKEVEMGKYKGLGVVLHMGLARVQLCHKASDLLGIHLAEGETVKISRIEVTLETDAEVAPVKIDGGETW